MSRRLGRASATLTVMPEMSRFWTKLGCVCEHGGCQGAHQLARLSTAPWQLQMAIHQTCLTSSGA